MKKIMRILSSVVFATSLYAFASDYKRAEKRSYFGRLKKTYEVSKKGLPLDANIKKALGLYQGSKIDSAIVINFLKSNPKYVNAEVELGPNWNLFILDWALRQNDTLLIEYLLNNKANTEILDSSGRTPLLNAMYSREPINTSNIQLLLEAGANVNAKDKEGRTPLMYAAALRHDPGIVNALLLKKADINARDNEGNTVLHLIVFYFRNDRFQQIKAVIQKLILSGVDPLLKNSAGKDMYDEINGNLDLLTNNDKRNELIKFIQNLQQQYSHKKAMQEALASTGSASQDVSALLGEYVTGPRDDQQRRFNSAVAIMKEMQESRGKVAEVGPKIAKRLMEEIKIPDDIFEKDALNYTLLHIAAGSCEAHFIRSYLKAIYDQNKANLTTVLNAETLHDKKTPLDLARAHKLSLEKQREKNEKEGKLGDIVRCRRVIGTIESYLDKINSTATVIPKTSTQEITAIFDAVKSSKKHAGKDLIDYIRAGKDVNLKELESGKTLLIHAVQANNKEAVAELLRANADANAVDDSGNTALIYAVEQGDPDIVSMLLARMNPDAIRKVNKAGENALSIAELELAKGMGTLEGERKKITQQPDQPAKKFEFSKASAEQKKAFVEKMALGVEIDKLSSKERRYLEIVRMLQKYEK